MSNHEAEFHAIIKALAICIRTFPGKIVSFRTDSQIVVDVIEKNHTKNKVFYPLLLDINKKATLFPHFFIKQIPNKQNYHADRLAKQRSEERRVGKECRSRWKRNHESE